LIVWQFKELEYSLYKSKRSEKYNGRSQDDIQMLIEEIKAFPVGLKAFKFTVTYGVVTSVSFILE